MDYILALVIVVAMVLNSLIYSYSGKEFRRKFTRVGQVVLIMFIVYYIVKGVRTGDKFDFAFAALFIAVLLIEYFNRKNNKHET